MDSTRFNFTLSIPRDPQFVALARQLAEQAARYGGCRDGAAEAFAGSVEEAVRTCVGGPRSNEPVSILVRRDAGPVEAVVDGRVVAAEP